MAKRHQNAPLEKTLPDLPLDIITQILLKLPVKDLSRSKCVSKTWRSLISNPRFIKDHLKLSSEDKDLAHHRLVVKSNERIFSLKGCSLSSLVQGSNIELQDLDYPMKQQGNYIVLVASCNGLVCLRLNWKDLFLCNFSTGEFKQLPYPSFTNKYGYPCAFGFGYDEANDDYNVTCHFHCPLFLEVDPNHNELDNEGQMYSLRNDCWKSIGGFRGKSNGCSGLFVKGKLHWMVLKDQEWEILSFDLGRENYEVLEAPKISDPNNQFWFRSLNVYEGCLTMLCDFAEAQIAEFWVMKEYGKGETWEKMASFTYDSGIHGGFCPKMVCSLEKGKILMRFGWSALVFFCPEDSSFEYPSTWEPGRYQLMDVYIERLVSPKNYGRLEN